MSNNRAVSSLAWGLAVVSLCIASTSQGAAPPPAPEIVKRYEVLAKPVPTGVQDLLIIQKGVKDVLKKAMPATVGLRIGASAGSGVIISEDGYILTAGHVSGKPGQVCDVILSTGKIVKGKTLGQNTGIDSGMIKITTKGKYPFAEMGKSASLKSGQWLIAIGHPRGYIPGRSPVVRVGRIIFANKDVIRTDNALVGGDSGGPLFDFEGRVIGIHSRINVTMEMNFHVPVDTYHVTWDRLAKGDSWGGGLFDTLFPPRPARTARAFMGVEFDPETQDLKFLKIAPGKPAEKAGLKPGDTITEIDGTKLAKRTELMTFMMRKKPGETITLKVDREGTPMTFKLKLVERPPE